MNAGYVKLYILDKQGQDAAGYLTVAGVALIGTNGKPLLASGMTPTKLKHGDSLRIDIADPVQESKECESEVAEELAKEDMSKLSAEELMRKYKFSIGDIAKLRKEGKL